MIKQPETSRLPLLFASVLVIGIILRCIAWSNTAVIDPDGALYIHQAKAIHHSQWKSLTGCGLGYVSNYPIFVAGAYKIFSDWIVAGRIVSFVFGVAFLIPLYLLLRQFFDGKISSLTTLIFAVMPMFVGRSVDVLRDPTYWFFLVSGLYFLIARIGKQNNLFLLLSSLCFLMAAWARTEAILFIVISFFYLLFADRKIRTLLIFVSPLILIVIVGFLGAMMTGISIDKLHRGAEILEKFSAPIIQYRSLRNDLGILAENHGSAILPLFLSGARSNIWLVALGMLFNTVLEAFFHPFFLIFLIGLKDIRQKIREDRRLAYFSTLAILSLAMLYVHIFHRWIMDYRFLAIFVIPCSVFTGFGLKNLISWLGSRFSWKESSIIPILALLILISALPKNSKLRDADKQVFREIGEFIANREGNSRIIAISASNPTQRWVSFYANLQYEGAVCPEPTNENCWEFFDTAPQSFFDGLKKRNIRYFLWTKQRWNKTFDLFGSPYRRHLKELRRWYHPDTKEMVLFEVM